MNSEDTQKLVEFTNQEEPVKSAVYRIVHGHNVHIVFLNERERALFNVSDIAFTNLWGRRIVRGMKPALQARWNQIVEDFHTPEVEETTAE